MNKETQIWSRIDIENALKGKVCHGQIKDEKYPISMFLILLNPYISTARGYLMLLLAHGLFRHLPSEIGRYE